MPQFVCLTIWRNDCSSPLYNHNQRWCLEVPKTDIFKLKWQKCRSYSKKTTGPRAPLNAIIFFKHILWRAKYSKILPEILLAWHLQVNKHNFSETFLVTHKVFRYYCSPDKHYIQNKCLKGPYNKVTHVTTHGININGFINCNVTKT